MQWKLAYPETRQDEVVDDYHGTAVADPYRWLEEAQSAETQAWIAAQNEITRSVLDEIPARAAYKQRLAELWDFTKYGVPVQRGGRYFLSILEGLQNQPVLYALDRLDGERQVVLDPNTLSEDGTVALISESFSRDGSQVAYVLSSSGSDWQEVRIRNVVTGEDYPEVLRWCKFGGIAWLPDGSGFYYDRHPEPDAADASADAANETSRLYWHTLGTDQAEDTLVYHRPDRDDLNFPPSALTEDGRYLVLFVWHGAVAKNRLYYREMGSEGDFVPLIDEGDASFQFLGNEGERFFVWTDWEAPRGRVVAIDLSQPAREAWRELIPESEDVIAFAEIVNGRFVIAYAHNAHHQIKVFGLDGRYQHDIPLPTIGSIIGLTGKPSHTELFIAFESFVHPTTILRYDFAAAQLETVFQPELAFEAADYVTEQRFFESKDGTQVPMFITHKRGLTLNSENPTLLYGYGGFSISLTPVFSVQRLPWLEGGGVFAYVNLRGGNEFGDEWHTAGMLDRKQNVFDDFISAAEYLIASGYTRPQKLAINGRSNGGLLVAATMLQRPDLFGAVVCGVPVIDMLRYHRFTAGRYWTHEYGNAEENAAHFRFMVAYSPLHNVRQEASYPPILITTADTDDRVVPLHSFKFAATLQAANPENLTLLRTEVKAGHGLGKPTAKIIEEAADEFGFIWGMLA